MAKTSLHKGIYFNKSRSVYVVQIYYGKGQIEYAGSYKLLSQAKERYNHCMKLASEGKRFEVDPKAIKKKQPAAPKPEKDPSKILNKKAKLNYYIGRRTPEQWAKILESKIECVNLRSWIANIIMFQGKDDIMFHPSLDKIADLYEYRANTMGSKELEEGFNAVNLPYYKSPFDDSSPSFLKKGRARNGGYRKNEIERWCA